MPLYEIKRHSGNNNHIWRTVLTTEDYKEACDRFLLLSKYLRQGTLIMYEDGIAIFKKTTPRLRTKW
jgi:hypothetical protein